jgi:hypothetical protein
MLYKYPQAAYPYEQLLEENRRRNKQQPEYELIDTGIFGDNRYFDVEIEYAKADCEDILMRLTVCNRGPEPATVHVLPQVWFRNTWSWVEGARKPSFRTAAPDTLTFSHDQLGSFSIHFEAPDALLFCENETNAAKVFGAPAGAGYFKDAIDARIVHGRENAVNPALVGSKAAAHYQRLVPSGGHIVARIRLHPGQPRADASRTSMQCSVRGRTKRTRSMATCSRIFPTRT